MAELYQAHRQWHHRPLDERFDSFDSLYNAVAARAARAHQRDVPLRDLRVVVTPEGDLRMHRQGTNAQASRLSHWSFNQIAGLVKTPPNFIRELSPETAAIVMNERIALASEQRADKGKELVQVYLDVPGDGKASLVRAFTSTDYGRALDRDYLDRIRHPIQAGGWQLPLGYEGGKWGAKMVPSGAYASDRDLFLFMVDYSRPIELKGERLFRGFFTWNSEVGKKSWAFMSFLLREVCGNNIVWGAQGINLIRVYHRGDDVLERISSKADTALKAYVNQDTSAEVRVITAAKAKQVAKNDPEAVEWLVEQDFTRVVAKHAVDRAKEEEGGAGTLWDLVQGLTAHARSIPHQDTRNALETQAGALLDLVN